MRSCALFVIFLFVGSRDLHKAIRGDVAQWTDYLEAKHYRTYPNRPRRPPPGGAPVASRLQRAEFPPVPALKPTATPVQPVEAGCCLNAPQKKRTERDANDIRETCRQVSDGSRRSVPLLACARRLSGPVHGRPEPPFRPKAPPVSPPRPVCRTRSRKRD